jgi:hypothetical protein
MSSTFNQSFSMVNESPPCRTWALFPKILRVLLSYSDLGEKGVSSKGGRQGLSTIKTQEMCSLGCEGLGLGHGEGTLMV